MKQGTPQASHSLRERLEEKVDRSQGVDACHPWLGNLGQHGQPTFYLSKTRQASTRRIAWEVAHGAPPTKDQWVTITCETTACLNPKHLTLRSVRRSPEDRLWCKVDRSGGPDACWVWQGEKRKKYGVVKLRSFRRPGKSPQHERIQAHRLAWIVTHGPIPDDLIILHSCDNPPCCNPKHLRPGTDAENMADMDRKGRRAHGPKHAEACRLGHARRKERLAS